MDHEKKEKLYPFPVPFPATKYKSFVIPDHTEETMQSRQCLLALEKSCCYSQALFTGRASECSAVLRAYVHKP